MLTAIRAEVPSTSPTTCSGSPRTPWSWVEVSTVLQRAFCCCDNAYDVPHAGLLYPRRGYLGVRVGALCPGER